MHKTSDRYWTRIVYFTEEEELAHAFAEVGPLVAVGAPGEELPELGAARVHLAHDAWRTGVEELLARSRFVIVRAGATPGLVWEMVTAARTVAPERLLVLVGDPRAYAAFRDLANPTLPQPLPPFTTGSQIGASRGFIAFSRESAPHLLPFRRQWLRWAITHPYLPEMLFALRPLFAEQGLPWRKPAIPAWKYVVMLLVIAILATQLL
jgi:hypothetical protein